MIDTLDTNEKTALAAVIDKLLTRLEESPTP